MNEIILGDCMGFMKKLPDKSIDLIITDPPYGKKADKGTNGFGAAANRRYRGGGGTVKDHTKKCSMKCEE